MATTVMRTCPTAACAHVVYLSSNVITHRAVFHEPMFVTEITTVETPPMSIHARVARIVHVTVMNSGSDPRQHLCYGVGLDVVKYNCFVN